jgi:Uma2 family endonuclease
LEDVTMAMTHQPAPPLWLGPAGHGRPVSDDDLVAAAFEEPGRYEHVAGKLVVMSPDGEEHDDVAETWRDALVDYTLAHRDRVQTAVPEARVRAGRGRSRIGDVASYLVRERSPQRRPKRAPDLVVDVVSPGAESWRRDAVETRREYHELGVWDYVLVDDRGERVIVLTHAPGGYAKACARRGRWVPDAATARSGDRAEASVRRR